MTGAKKEIRAAFRAAVFKRDRHRCRSCGLVHGDENLDAHHITDRKEMPHGGYVPENGIAVCGTCHVKAEQFHRTGVAADGFAPADLYVLIGSSYEKAYAASLKLKE